MAFPVALNGSKSVFENHEEDPSPSPISFKPFAGFPTLGSSLKKEESKRIYSLSIPPLAKFVNSKATLKISPSAEQISYLFFRIGMEVMYGEQVGTISRMEGKDIYLLFNGYEEECRVERSLLSPWISFRRGGEVLAPNPDKNGCYWFGKMECLYDLSFIEKNMPNDHMQILFDGSRQRGLPFVPVKRREIWPVYSGFHRAKIHEYLTSFRAREIFLHKCALWKKSDFV